MRLPMKPAHGIKRRVHQILCSATHEDHRPANAVCLDLQLRSANAGTQLWTLAARLVAQKTDHPLRIHVVRPPANDFSEQLFCLIGSAKSNIGHCESAAGMAGLTKVLLQMQHRQIVPSLHSAQLNPHIDFAKTPFIVNQRLTEWEQPEIEGRKVPRMAGISSFGAGGSNAHLIVEEYEAAVGAPMAVTNAAIVLSARTAEQLRQKAHDLLTFIGTRQTPIDVASVAYTLQVGREAMEERLGVVVGSVEKLTEKLEAFARGEEGIEEVYRGQVKRDKGALTLFSTDADLQQTIEKWIANRKVSNLIELWVKGLELDWSRLYGEDKPQRISLPAYPFAKERYWIEMEKVAAPAGAKTSVIHPLLHTNTSDLTQQSYSTVFTGDEPFLEDRKLVAATYMEMARAAVQNATHTEGSIDLGDVEWGEPFVANGQPIHIALLARSNEEIEFEIYSEEAVHCQGRAVVGAQAKAKADREQPAEKKKAISLVAPSEAGVPQPAASRARLTLSDTTTITAPAANEGIVSIEVASAEGLRGARRAKVVLLSGLEHIEDSDELNGELASFPAPVIAVLRNDTMGAGFRAAALCDLMVCSEEASYGGVQPSAFLCERFGEVLGQDLWQTWTGKQLRGKGWTAPVVAAAEVEAHARELATSLASKSREGLALLKEHLTRGNIASDDEPVGEDDGAVGQELVVISLGDLQHGLAEHKRLVIRIEDGEVADDVLRQIAEAEVPVVAALSGNATGNAWLAALLCDAAVHSREGIYSASGTAASAAAVFAYRFGHIGREILLTGTEYSGASLQRTAIVADQDEVLARAVQLAKSVIKRRAPWNEVTERAEEIVEQPIVLRSPVVSATAHPGGIVVVTMEEREAKNMFSERLIDSSR